MYLFLFRVRNKKVVHQVLLFFEGMLPLSVEVNSIDQVEHRILGDRAWRQQILKTQTEMNDKVLCGARFDSIHYFRDCATQLYNDFFGMGFQSVSQKRNGKMLVHLLFCFTTAYLYFVVCGFLHPIVDLLSRSLPVFSVVH